MTPPWPNPVTGAENVTPTFTLRGQLSRAGQASGTLTLRVVEILAAAVNDTLASMDVQLLSEYVSKV